MRRRTKGILGLWAALLGLAMVGSYVWMPESSFRRAYGRIEVRMTRDEVIEIMGPRGSETYVFRDEMEPRGGQWRMALSNLAKKPRCCVKTPPRTTIPSSSTVPFSPVPFDPLLAHLAQQVGPRIAQVPSLAILQFSVTFRSQKP
jgi:hypothetical protein